MQTIVTDKQEQSSFLGDNKDFVKSLSLVVFLLFSSILLFYGAGIAKTSAENNYLQTLEAKAKQDLELIIKQTHQALDQKITTFDYVLKDSEYINKFNDKSWQKAIISGLQTRFGEHATVEFIPANFNNDDIIENPEMSYGILSLLNELEIIVKSHSTPAIKIDVHRTAKSNIQLLFVRAFSNTDVSPEEPQVLGYILVRFDKYVIDELIKEAEIKNNFIEIVQVFSDDVSVLASKGESQLKNLPLSVSSKINNTQWLMKYWPEAQKNSMPISSLWLVIICVVLGVIALISAVLILIPTIKSYRAAREISLPDREVGYLESHIVAHSLPGDNASKIITDNGSSADDGISVEDDYFSHIMDKIFRAYDVRGIVGEYINAEVFREIAQGIAIELVEQQQTQISVGCDGRTSSPELVKTVIDTLLECGINVLDIGMVTSPMLYFSAITKTDGNGIIVTASHNPANYNGMKIMLLGHSYNETRLQNLKHKVISGTRVSGNGSLTEENVFEDYLTKIMANVILARPMSIVVDSGNGVTGKFATAFFEKLGCKVTAINSEVNGDFPIHDPDPSRPENMTELAQKVTELKADIGFAFDGDGDRIGLITSGGEIIWPDRILMLLAKDILSRNKEAIILYDVKSSRNLENYIHELGGTTQMCKTGHSFMKSKLLETKALLAGEMSGHIFIKERWFGFDDAMFVAARILEILSIDLRKSRQIFGELPDSLNTPEILVATDRGKAIIEKISEDTSCFADGKIIDIDGIRVEYDDGWGLVRSSNTTENLTMRFEAEDEVALQRIANTFKEAILAVEPEMNFPF